MQQHQASSRPVVSPMRSWLNPAACKHLSRFVVPSLSLSDSVVFIWCSSFILVSVACYLSRRRESHGEAGVGGGR